MIGHEENNDILLSDTDVHRHHGTICRKYEFHIV